MSVVNSSADSASDRVEPGPDDQAAKWRERHSGQFSIADSGFDARTMIADDFTQLIGGWTVCLCGKTGHYLLFMHFMEA